MSGSIDSIGRGTAEIRPDTSSNAFSLAVDSQTTASQGDGAPRGGRIGPDSGISQDASLLPTLEIDIGTQPAGASPATPDLADTGVTTTPAARTERAQADQILRGNTGRVEILPPTPVGDVKINVRADVTLPAPALGDRIDANAPAGDGGRQTTTGTFGVRATAAGPDGASVTLGSSVTLDPAMPEPLRNVSGSLDITPAGQGNVLNNVGGGVTLSRTATNDLYVSGANASVRLLTSPNSDVSVGPVFGFKPPGAPAGDSVGASVSFRERSPSDGNGTIRQTTTTLGVSATDTGGTRVNLSYANGARNSLGNINPDTTLSVQYANTPGVESRVQFNVQFFNLP
jgi:hypothetical protein